MLDHDNKSPESGSEKLIVLLISSAFLILMGLEIASNFTPRKAGGILFIFFWFPLLVLHEFGHAIVAKFFGWKLHEIVIGFGKQRKEFTVMGTQLKVNTFPLEGFVRCEPVNVAYSNWKHALIFFAGPGIELLLVAVIGFIIGFDNLFKLSDNYTTIALQSCAYAALMGAIINLIPFSSEHDGKASMSDGAGILACLFYTDKEK